MQEEPGGGWAYCTETQHAANDAAGAKGAAGGMADGDENKGAGSDEEEDEEDEAGDGSFKYIPASDHLGIFVDLVQH